MKNMELIGQNLKKSRLAKKIEIKHVSADLNISSGIIKGIENNEKIDFLDQVYLIGHVRAYAKYLDLDENYIVEKFKVENSFIREDVFNELPKPVITNNLFAKSRTISFFSVAMISFIFYLLFVRTYDSQPNYSITPDIPENLQFIIEESEMEVALNNITKLGTESKISKKLNNNFINLDNEINITENSVIASLPNKEELNEFNFLITLKFVNSTWIQLRNEQDSIVFSKLMNPNEEYTYSILDKYSLTTGNAGNILVSINGEVKGKVGKKGEVIESLIINSDFNN